MLALCYKYLRQRLVGLVLSFKRVPYDSVTFRSRLKAEGYQFSVDATVDRRNERHKQHGVRDS